jgi:hypothetical protein
MYLAPNERERVFAVLPGEASGDGQQRHDEDYHDATPRPILAARG